jgi:integral membrane sensor domain MASE1
MAKERNQSGIYIFLIIVVMAAIINALLSRFAVVTFPSAPGVSALYFAAAFMITFTLWFGIWGAIAAYLGCFIGAGLADLPVMVNLYWSLADFWVVLIPLIAFRKYQADVGLQTKRDFLVFYIFGWLLASLAGAIWGSIMLAVGGIIGWSDVLNTFITWFIGDLIVTVAITPLLLRYFTGYIVRWGLDVKGYWTFGHSRSLSTGM